MTLTTEQLRDLRQYVLRELYRCAPRGRTAKNLFWMRPKEFAVGSVDVDDAVEFLEKQHLVEALSMDPLSPGSPPLWAITEDGKRFCREQRII
jgi:hypothetical protein